MTEEFIKQMIEDQFDFEKKLQETDEEFAKLERNIEIEKEYVDRSISGVQSKIKFFFTRDKIIKQFEEKFSIVNFNNRKVSKKIKKLNSKSKSLENGIEMLKTIMIGYINVKRGIDITNQALKEIEKAFEDTKGINELVGVMKDLKDIAKYNYENMKDVKAEIDSNLFKHKDHIMLCLTELSERSKSYDRFF